MPARYLEPQVPVGVDLGVRHPSLQIGRLPGVGAKQIDHRVKADFIQGLFDPGVVFAVQPGLELVEVKLRRPEPGRTGRRRSPLRRHHCSRGCRWGRP